MNNSILPTYNRSNLFFERGQGSWLETKEGDLYLDFGAGIAVNSLGHCHPKLVETLKNQAEKIWHTSNLHNIMQQNELADFLVENTFAEKVFFTNSGAESVECAIKMARKHFYDKGLEKKNRIITLNGSFHGRTLGTIAAAGEEKLTKGFGPKLQGFDQVASDNLTEILDCIDDQTAAILMEPIQGEGGIKSLETSYLREVRTVCDENDILLIFDEVQCGVGRSGRMWAHEWSGVKPDIMATAKALGGGFPIGACMAIEEVGNAFIPGTHGSTFGGNPVASAIANTVLDIVDEREFLQNVTNVGDILDSNLQEIIKGSSIISEIRGRGLMVGLQCLIPAGDVISAFREQKLLSVGAEGNTVRFLPPLIINEIEVNEACIAVDKALQQLES